MDARHGLSSSRIPLQYWEKGRALFPETFPGVSISKQTIHGYLRCSHGTRSLTPMQYLLFTTSTCPKCPAFKQQVSLTLGHMQGSTIDERHPDFARLTDEYSIGSVPLLLIFDDENRESAALRTSEIADVLSFARAHAV